MAVMFQCQAREYQYEILLTSNERTPIFPYIRDIDGNKTIYSISTEHGRSFIICKRNDDRWVVSKGNGLSYTPYVFLNTGEMGDDTLGLLLRKDAERDFLLGQEIASLGIKTNHMEYVLEIDNPISLPNSHKIKPILLQYNVECPYRISDAFILHHNCIINEVKKWEKYNDKGFDKNYLIAANVLIRNLSILHKHKILHNAIHAQNYTWALELLDFELACSPRHPYESEDYQRHVPSLFSREIIHTYQIICMIAQVLKEKINHYALEDIFEQYGFNIRKFNVA